MGKFSLKIAYNCLIENDRFASDRIFKEVWRLQVPQRLKAFMWIVAHDALLTNAARVRRGMANDDKCILCDKSTKTMSMSFGTVTKQRTYGQVSAIVLLISLSSKNH